MRCNILEIYKIAVLSFIHTGNINIGPALSIYWTNLPDVGSMTEAISNFC